MGFIGGFIIIVMWVLAVFVIRQCWNLFRYFMEGAAMYKIARRRGLENPWRAWVPILNSWLRGSIADQYQFLTCGRQTKRKNQLMNTKIIQQAYGVAGWLCYVVAVVAMTFGSYEIFPEYDWTDIYMAALGLGILAMLAKKIPTIILMVHTYIASYDLFASSKPKKENLFLVLSILFPVTLPFFIFFCRKSDAGLPVQGTEMPAATVPAEEFTE